MKFPFREAVQVTAGPNQSTPASWREHSLHASAVHEATERFLRHQLQRKREKQFANSQRS